jgi:serine phosphatase RsbU (regulator of sigma subunit)/predicted ester cyclase
MSTEENKAVSNRVAEAINSGDMDAFDELMAADLAQESKREIANLRRAFPDFHGTNEIQIAEGDFVANRYVAQGTHLGEFMGIAPTGEKHTFVALSIDRVVNGKSVEHWVATVEEEDTFQQRIAQKALERERIEQELQVARRIQHALLPKALPELQGLEISHQYQPAREVGGDFYDFLPLADGRVGLVIGDVSGKGVPAAVLMASTLSVLRALIQREGITPGQVLAEANEVLCTYIPPNMFVTCFYAILDPKSGYLVYTNAGHDLPYLRRRGGDAEELRARGMPLGLMPGMGYEEKEITLDVGDSALFYSDGLVEAHDSQRREMFGFPRLRALVAEHGEEPSLESFLLERLYAFVGEGWEQEDDITLLTLRRSASLS